ncbi:MAG TPA: hypothetical protein VNA25_11155 [Phycisphaerae bacterium]|nr:hypothetical protein [Phycisphaerae bacterium]
MGKYTELAKSLPVPPDDASPDWLKPYLAAITDDSPGGLVAQYKAARAVKDDLGAQVKENNKTIMALERVIIRVFGESNLQSCRAEGGGLVSIHPDVNVKVTDRDAIREWAMANGHERDLNINPQTLSGIVKQMAIDPDAGGIPPGVELTAWTKLTFSGKG